MSDCCQMIQLLNLSQVTPVRGTGAILGGSSGLHRDTQDWQGTLTLFSNVPF